LTAKDALAAHAHDELGISDTIAARPLQAAVTSAITFSAGAILPLVAVLLSPPAYLSWAVTAGSAVFLALLGLAGAKTGGAGIFKPTVRVVFWGSLAMAVTAGVGLAIGRAV
jgi:VIT1/CCC1 family predicted Fe2+/Mn2+ transporter